MKFSLLAGVVASLAAQAAAQYGNCTKCFSQAYGEQIVAEYQAVIAQVNSSVGTPAETIMKLAARNYHEYSDSAISIGGIPIPLGQPLLTNRTSFLEESQGNLALDTTTTGIYVACNVITWMWTSYNLGTGVYEFNGIHVFTLNDDGRLADTHFEFNGIAAALDTGYAVVNLTSGVALDPIPQLSS